ncbi:BTAD domain-containing putative transcriptional regulator [Desulfonatronum thioautotrophicum]|uniref:BTAD domain-containing putative transcriptional regulator n=1 Tax=Desulfonatronum thioautotrophicum TaxID=617001 RepID=UPI0005EB9C43|nr:BTAD domain-containing putative transcriptional regulator [Desulfonatronum thioautotrophicum]
MAQSLLAKFTPPEIGALVVRERLVDCLDSAVARPITWISAPPGSGKTVLVASYVVVSARPCIWYQLDDSDTDPVVFFTRLVQAATAVLGEKKDKLPTLHPLRQNDLLVFTDIFFQRLASLLPNNCLIVFDNCNFGDSETHPEVYQRIFEAFAALPAGCNTLITSRLNAPRHSARMLVERRVNFLGWDDLRFTLPECKQLLGNTSFSNAVFELLLQQTQGWAAGLVLLGETLRRGGAIVGTSPWIPKQRVFDYLDHELFRIVRPDIRDFLIKTAFLRKMTVDMARAMSGSDQAKNILLRLFRNNHFTLRRSVADPEYEYHPLFALFLLSIAEKEYSAEKVNLLRCQAAKILESAGRLEDAVDLLTAAKAESELERLLLEHAEALTAQGRFQTLEAWISSLSSDALERTPWLLYWLGVCFQFKDPARSRELLQMAFEKFRVASNDDGMLTVWCGIVDTFIYDWNDFISLEQWIVALEGLLAEGVQIPSTELGARVASCMVGALVYQRPNRSEDIQHWLELALQQRFRIQPGYVHLHAVFHAAYHAMWMGDLVRLRVIAERIHEAIAVADMPTVHVLNGQCLEALVQSLCFARGDLALKAVEKGLRLARQNNVTAWNFMLFGQGVFAALTMGNVSVAEYYLKEMEHIVPRTRRFARGHYHYTAAVFHLFCGSPLPAALDAAKALRIAKETGAAFAFPYFAMVLAQACHETEEYEECAQLMDSVDEFIAGSGSKMQEFMWLLYAAYFAIDQGQTAQGLHFLRKGFALGRREGYVNMFWQWRPKMMARLCAVALQNTLETAYARHLIRYRNLALDLSPLEVPHWPWLIRIFTLGHFEIYQEATLIHFARKAQQRPLELLKVLVAVGERGSSEGEVCDLLWPDSDGDRAHSALTTTLSRLRRLLGCSETIVVSNAQISLNSCVCWVDAWSFKQACEQIRKMQESSCQPRDGQGTDEDTARFYLLAKQAMDLYRGHFLPTDLNFSWTISTRERLRSKFYELVTNLGDALEQLEDWTSARRCYLQAMDVDDLQEDICLRLIRCAQRLGRPLEARAAFSRFQERLKAEFNMEVSPVFENLGKELGLAGVHNPSKYPLPRSP